jgi:hypothetical protein
MELVGTQVPWAAEPPSSLIKAADRRRAWILGCHPAKALKVLSLWRRQRSAEVVSSKRIKDKG